MPSDRHVPDRGPRKSSWQKSGYGSLVVNITISRLASYEFEPSAAEDPPCSGLLHVKSIGAQMSLSPPLVWKLLRGCGSPVVKVSDHGRHVMSSSPIPLKTRRVGQPCTLNLSRAVTSSRWCGVVVRRGGGVPAQVSSTSFDYGSKLRGPSSKALV
ncbi:uncharacterized protein TNCV_1318651 [Trichonephila clavipes]|nr:uncharacterized protein TNCV_1318651 [Trichonephila clavipes]